MSSPSCSMGSGHPYGRHDTPESVTGLTRDDMVHVFKTIFLPNNAALIVVGDTTPDVITAKLEESLKDWKPGEAPEWKYPNAAGTSQGSNRLSRRQAGRGAVGDLGGEGRSPAQYARLLPAGRHERGARRSVLQPDQPQPARGQRVTPTVLDRVSTSSRAPALSRRAARSRPP